MSPFDLTAADEVSLDMLGNLSQSEKSNMWLPVVRYTEDQTSDLV
jgi:hypothetical protein